jgi:DNA polymerase (family 10)
MPVHNEDVARVFDEIGDLLEIRAENPFRIRAYRNAAREVRGLPRELAQISGEGGDLTRLPGIGEALAGKIEEILNTGSCRALERLHRELPADVSALLRIPGLGPRRVHALHYDLDIHTPEQLRRAAKDHRLRQLPGFGPKTEARVAAELEAHLTADTRLKLAQAARYAEPLTAWLASAPGVVRAVAAGSYRRRKETVGDLDIVVAASDPEAVMERFSGYEDAVRTDARGTSRATLHLRGGLQVDLRVVEAASFGAALHYFTGSKAHNIAVRALARGRGLKVNEYGVFHGGDRVAGETEASVFAAVDLPWIPPELREGEGEIEAARRGLLPRLVERRDLRGDLHCHTRASDGHGSLADMATAARREGLDYLAITDHSKRLTMVHGLDSRRLLEQLDQIDRLNEGLDGIRLLKGIEVDILENGELDLPDEVLGRLDLVVGAVHSAFRLGRREQTSRILKAMDHPHFSILAHPTGRLIAEREPCDADMARVIRHARDRGCFLELNANPQRLDLLAVYCRMAREEGVLVSIDSDAHSEVDFANLHYGVGQARRGWLEAKDVLNTRTLERLLPLLRRTM